MPGLVPGIHVLLSFFWEKSVDGRDNHCEDVLRTFARP
ncbi:MAG: hypothetical protein QOI05_841 [Bradyrhizobium sp.]|jgi:hypothetical protein|nr:hypothetical protein [Bradyrhizobium sp.]